MNSADQQHDRLNTLKSNIAEAYHRQIERQGCHNARMSTGDLIGHCSMRRDTKSWLAQTGERLKLSGRSLHRCLRVGRTIADLEGRDEVTEGDLSEALLIERTLTPLCEPELAINAPICVRGLERSDVFREVLHVLLAQHRSLPHMSALCAPTVSFACKQ